MADRVEANMERMAPHLDEMKRLEIFSDAEIRALVNRRRDMEYAMQRRVPLKADFVRAIQYELNLESLRKHRKHKLEIDAKCSSDFGIVQRVSQLYSRALQKFPDDVDLWHQYIDYGVHTNSIRVLETAFARVLQLHPTKPEFWIKAMTYEFDMNNNAKAARVLLQRGLRMNEANPMSLYLAFFKMELQYIRRLCKRRQLLGYSKPADEVEAQERIKEEQFLSGAMPKLIFDKAVTAMPDDAAFRLQFVQLVPDGDLFASVSDHVMASVARDFPSDVASWKARAEYALRRNSGRDAVVKVLVEAVEACANSSAVWSMVLDFVYAQSANSSAWRGYLKEMFVQAHENGALSERSMELWITVLLANAEVEEALQRCFDAVSSDAFSGSSRLWSLYISIRLRQSVVYGSLQSDAFTLHELIRTVLLVVSADEAVALWAVLLRLNMIIGANEEAILAIFTEAISTVSDTAPLDAFLTLQSLAIGWCSARVSSEAARTLIIDIASNLRTPAELIIECLRVLQGHAQIDTLRMVYNRGLDRLGHSHPELWVRAIELETAEGDLKSVQRLQWKARSTLDNPDPFVETLI